MRRRLIVALALLTLAALPVTAAERIEDGADVWRTATGTTFTSFEKNPIPAGFFCPGSKPFTGRIALRGEPLKTAPAGSLGNVDTIVRRLDAAAFNENGEASTRIQLLALSLAGVKPFDSGCGLFDVKVSLAGEQPVTEMKILRTSPQGGTYLAPLKLNVKLAFIPVGGKVAAGELTNQVSLGPASGSVWSYARKAPSRSTVRVDTDGDGTPDTLMPAASNFVAGVAPALTFSTSPARYCPKQVCHCSADSTDVNQSATGCASDHIHCIWVQVPCATTATDITETQTDGTY